MKMMQTEDSVLKLGDIHKDIATMHINVSKLERGYSEIKRKLNFNFPTRCLG